MFSEIFPGSAAFDELFNKEKWRFYCFLANKIEPIIPNVTVEILQM